MAAPQMSAPIKAKYILVYEIGITALAMLSIALLIVSFTVTLPLGVEAAFNTVDMVILVIFALDYAARFIFAPKKFIFIKNNIPDLLSIIPFNQIFRAFRVVRLARVLRLFKAGRVIALLGKISLRSKTLFKTNNLHYVIYVTVCIVFLGALGVYLVEGKPFEDALWWSFVTVTTVGYGDISPVTGIGRFIAVILMLTGIGFIGTLTSAIATYFIRPTHKKNAGIKTDVVELIKTKLDNYEALTDEDLDTICCMLSSLKRKGV